MTKLADRKTRLQFTTGAEVRYRGKLRPIVVEVDNPFSASVRLLGTRQRLPFAWQMVYNMAARVEADRIIRERKAARANRRKGLL